MRAAAPCRKGSRAVPWVNAVGGRASRLGVASAAARTYLRQHNQYQRGEQGEPPAGWLHPPGHPGPAATPHSRRMSLRSLVALLWCCAAVPCAVRPRRNQTRARVLRDGVSVLLPSSAGQPVAMYMYPAGRPAAPERFVSYGCRVVKCE